MISHAPQSGDAVARARLSFPNNDLQRVGVTRVRNLQLQSIHESSSITPVSRTARAFAAGLHGKRDRQRMDLETVWYEAFPYLYGIGGVVAMLVTPGSLLLKISGALLIIAALTILRLRWVYRRDQFKRAPTPSTFVHQSTTVDDD